MFEAKLTEGVIFRKIVEAIKDVVNDVNIDVSPAGKHLASKKASVINFKVQGVILLTLF